MAAISKSALLVQLTAQISDNEYSAIKEHMESFLISEYNRETILRMMAEEKADSEAVNRASVNGLVNVLKSYLTRYMPEKPDDHKWIIICCVYLAMVAGEPMHPQQIVRWEIKDGKYFCPAREDGKESVCQYCVCKKRIERELL